MGVLGSLVIRVLKVSTMASRFTTSVLCFDRSCLQQNYEGLEKLLLQ